jgi:diacylglycerol kinase family enzyme
MNGTVLKRKNVEKIILSEKCRKVTITPIKGNIRICIDGEITDAGKTEFEIIHNGINFVVPKEKVLV